MARPVSTAVLRPELGAIAYQYMLEASQRGFIGDKLLPIFETPLQSAQYPVIPLEALIKVHDTKRAARAAYARSDYEFAMGNYTCKEYGWEEPVDDSEAALYDRFFKVEEVAVRRGVDIILRGREIRVAAKLLDTAVFGNSAVSVKWNVAATATPRANVMAGKQAMRAASGLDPNVLAISKKTFDNLMLTAEITNAFRYTNPIEIGGYDAQARIMAQYFGLDEVLIGGAIKDSAKKGQSASIANIWNDTLAGLYRTSSGGQDLREPCVGRSFLWTGDSPSILVTENYRDEEHRSNVYRTRQNVDEALVFTGAGYILSNIS